MSTRGSMLSARPDSPAGAAADVGVEGTATAPLRLWIYGLTLTLLAFLQSPGRIVGDTKFDLVVDPGRFMSRALDMWDGSRAFGQIQNQAYGYFFPMGPFFWLGERLQLDMWVVQRLWWTLLLCLAFFGTIKVARTLDLGRPWTQVVAAFAYALSCHITTVIGPTSVEVWPSALVPWVLWCVIRGTRGGSERRWAAAAGLLMGACGGVNAAAVLAALPVGVCWIATRKGRRSWVFLGWWAGATLLATLWWVIPLVLLGAYSFPFLDYIENANVTTLPTGLSDVLGGTSDWVFYYGSSFPAGHALAVTPVLLLDAMVLVAFGLAGVARRDNPHRRFLLLAITVGVLVVSFGYTGNGHGWFAETRQGWLDGALAPLRNLHKFDNVLRLPLALGVAHALGQLTVRGLGAKPVHRVAALVAVLAVVATTSPWWQSPKVAPTGAIASVPDYWRQAAAYLDSHDDKTTSVVVPSAAFGLYLWGSPRDDVLQPLLSSSWVTRDVIPFAQPGSVVLLDSLTEALESGRPNARLAEVLASNGISRVVVRNDLDRLATGAPDGVALHAVLDGSPHLQRVASFGPPLGSEPAGEFPNGVRVAPSGGLSGTYPAVEIYQVTLPTSQVQAVADSSIRIAAGGAPGDGLRGGASGPSILGDPGAAATSAPVELSDALPRREEDFAAVRDVSSATMTADQRWRLNRPVHQRVMVPDQGRWEATVAWRGVEGVTASSSRAWPDSAPPMRRGAAPDAAMDGQDRSAWESSPGLGAVGQWWQVDLRPGTQVGSVTIRLPWDSTVTRLSLTNGDRTLSVKAPAAGEPLTVPTAFGASDRLRVTATATAPGAELRPFSLAEVTVAGVDAERTVVLPAPPAGRSVDAVSLTRDPGTPDCLAVVGSVVCRAGLGSLGDDGTGLDRVFDIGDAGRFDLGVTGSWSERAAVTRELRRQLPFRLRLSPGQSTDVRAGALALVDGNPATTWIQAPRIATPRVIVTFSRRHVVSALHLGLSRTAAAVPATTVTVRAAGGTRAGRMSKSGSLRFRPLSGRTFRIEITSAAVGYDTSEGRQSRLGVGISSLGLYRDAGGRDLLDRSTQQFHGGCGTGPSIDVDGSAIPTAYDASISAVMSGRVRLRPCRTGVQLPAGTSHVVATGTDLLAVDHVQLDRAGSATRVPPTRLTASSWTDQRRVVAVPAAGTGRLLVVSQNFNDGWAASLHGHRLRAQEVDGWRQGWWLPAGSGGTVTLSFTPQRSFEGGLAVGLLGVLAAMVLLLVRPGGRRPVRAGAQERRWPAGVAASAMVLAGGFLAGWAGAAGVLGIVVVLVCSQRLRDRAWLLSGGLALLGGAVAAQHRASETTLSYEGWVQWVLTLALAAALPLASLPKGPTWRSRMKGISIT